MYSILLSKSMCNTLLQDYSIVPVAQPLPLNFDTSLSVFVKLKGDFLLESAESGNAMGRYSFIGKGIKRKFILHQDSIEDYILDNSTNILQPYIHDNLNTNPLEYVKSAMAEYTTPVDELYSLPPFWGGLLGYLGYETIGYFENITHLCKKTGMDIPDGILIIPKQLYIVDHLKHIIWLIAPISHIDEYENAYNEIRQHCITLQNPLHEEIYDYNKYILLSETKQNKEDSAYKTTPLDWISSLNEQEFIDKVQYCKECINRGDIIQVVFSRQLKASFDRNKELLLYMQLRNVNPSPYMYYLRFDEFAIVGSSPEKMVSLSLDRRIQVRPIAGTIRRGATQSEDKYLQQVLLQDEKERAEHIMLVDLGRNDLHRVAQPNTVHVPKYIEIEEYSHVYHIVSTVEGKLEDGKDGFDLIQATFPAGTLSGAPKIEAMNIIGRIEPITRNAYGGMILAMGFNGYLDSCITIRTSVLKDDMIYLNAGAGIVADSIPEKEWKETELKLGALIQAVETVQLYTKNSPIK